MGFIARFETNWADEMDVFGLKYFDSMDDYLKDFCWNVPFNFLGINIPRALDFLNIEYDHERWYLDDCGKKMMDYFLAHPNEMRNRYIKIFGNDFFDSIDIIDPCVNEHPYINFIYMSFLIMNEDDNSEKEGYIRVGTNEDIPMTLGEYVEFYIEPDIFAKDEIADAITYGSKYFSAGPFYM